MNQKNLWAPWRISYIKGMVGEDVPAQGGSGAGCFLCDATERGVDEASMRERLVLVNDQRGVLLLNRYPYTNGHLLASPRVHRSDLNDLSVVQRGGVMELAALGARLLEAAMNPQGMNVGMNLGRCAGAGLPGHVHMHVVPRWAGDVNFMSVVGGVRVIPQGLEASYQLLRNALDVIDEPKAMSPEP